MGALSPWVRTSPSTEQFTEADADKYPSNIGFSTCFFVFLFLYGQVAAKLFPLSVTSCESLRTNRKTGIMMLICQKLNWIFSLEQSITISLLGVECHKKLPWKYLMKFFTGWNKLVTKFFICTVVFHWIWAQEKCSILQKFQFN